MRTPRAFIGLAATTALALALTIGVFWFVYSQDDRSSVSQFSAPANGGWFSSYAPLSMGQVIIVRGVGGVRRVVSAGQPQSTSTGTNITISPAWFWAGLVLLVVCLGILLSMLLLQRHRKAVVPGRPQG